jgi:hypothetical protein
VGKVLLLDNQGLQGRRTPSRAKALLWSHLSVSVGFHANILLKTNRGTTETRTRAPLGNKTTNAKARTSQTVGVKDIIKEFEKTQTKPTTVQKPKHGLFSPGSSRVEVRNDQKGQQGEENVEYGPPRPNDLPYESDVLPNGALTFEGLKPENLLRGYYNTFYNPVDDDGVSLREREFEENMKKALQKGEERIKKEIEECDWSVCDVPETASYLAKKKAPQASIPTPGMGAKVCQGVPKYPPTIASRKAASALALSTDATKARAFKPLQQSANVNKQASSFLLPTKRGLNKEIMPSKSSMESKVDEALSRSTIGYTKGRSASSIVHKDGQPSTGGVGRAVGNAPRAASHSTVGPARLGQSVTSQTETAESLQRLHFLSIFDADEEADEALRGLSNPLLDEADEDFELKLEV